MSDLSESSAGTKRDVWLSKDHFEDGSPSCAWGVEGRTDIPLSVPPPGSLLVVFDQNLNPVKIWEVGSIKHLDPPMYEDGWTWFVGTEMSRMVHSSADTGVKDIDFHDYASLVFPVAGGWLGAPEVTPW